MLQYLAAAAFAIFAWWLSTAVILFAAGRQSPRRLPLLLVATAFAAAGLWAIRIGGSMEGLGGVYLGFVGGLAVWAWNETSFLAGVVTGPSRQSCPTGATGRARFRAAFATVRDHELAILASGAIVLAISWDAPNQTGLWTFALLWLMRISAKLLLFLGAPHVTLAMLPPRLIYLTTYFRTDRVSAAFPALLAATVLAFVLLCHRAATAPQLHEGVSATLLATFAALAVVEHLILVVPVSDAALWRWAMPARQSASETAPAPAGPETKTDRQGVAPRARQRHPVVIA